MLTVWEVSRLIIKFPSALRYKNPPTNIWAIGLEELDYEIPHLIETPYEGWFGYWVGSYGGRY